MRRFLRRRSEAGCCSFHSSYCNSLRWRDQLPPRRSAQSCKANHFHDEISLCKSMPIPCRSFHSLWVMSNGKRPFHHVELCGRNFRTVFQREQECSIRCEESTFRRRLTPRDVAETSTYFTSWALSLKAAMNPSLQSHS